MLFRCIQVTRMTLAALAHSYALAATGPVTLQFLRSNLKHKKHFQSLRL